MKFADFWTYFGSNQVAVIVTILGILVTLAGFGFGIIQITITGIVIIVVIGIAFYGHSKKTKKNPQALLSKKQCPYVTGKAVTKPQFVGRYNEGKLLNAYLESGESVSLLGDRRIGKSSLLATWKKHLDNNNYVVILLNGQNGEGADFHHFLQAIIKNAVPENISADDGGNLLVQWAEKNHLQSKNLPVILVDECETIIQNCPHRFWERVRGALDKIVWVFSSRVPLDVLYKHYHLKGSPFENQLKTLWLGLLDNDAAEELIQIGQFCTKDQELMRKWAGYHPFYLQTLGGHLWLNKPSKDTRAVLDAYQIEAQRHLDDLWDGLSQPEQQNLLEYNTSKQAIDNMMLRCRGVIDQKGHPFSKVLSDYLKDKQFG